MNASLLEIRFKENHGVLTARELQQFGISYYFIRKLLEDNVITKVKRGVYILNDSSEEELGLINTLIPKGIFCLQSAAYIYNYTTSIPLRHHIAVHNKSNLNLPDYPPVKLYYWQKLQYNVGVTEESLNDVIIKLYDREKTICDFIKFRNKLETSMVKEVINSYLQDTNRNIVKLKKYSKKLKISTVVDHYLEMMI